jgi:hypothetical protein
MSLIKMGLANYRCFAGQQSIELRPITVVLGRNNSGKSALVRAPLVLSTGIQTDSPVPLDLDLVSEQIVDSFTDLVYGGRPHGKIELAMDLSQDPAVPLRLNATVQNIDEFHTQIVSKLSLQSDDLDLRLIWEPSERLETYMRYTVLQNGEQRESSAFRFTGLLPTAVIGPEPSQDLTTILLRTASAVRMNFGIVRYLGPFRDRPIRFYRLPAGMPTTVGQSGDNTAAILASDMARNKGILLRQVNSGLRESLPGWNIEVIERGGMYTVALRSLDDDTLLINLADTGAGVAQALPIFVQRALDITNPPRSPVLEIVEQPELHLHPAAHATLADVYLAAARNTNVRFLIETHSETLLLRLRRRIAEGTVDPSTVAVYFVESVNGVADARPITIGGDGNIDYWPDGIFSEDYQETRALADAQLARIDADAR